MRKLLSTCLLSCICLITGADAIAQRAVQHGDLGGLSAITVISCGQGSLEYLPGDHYFRSGHRAFEEGKPRKAASMFESSAAWGDKRAMFNLGLMLYQGRGVPKDEPRGLAWLALSAERPKDRLHRETLASAWQAATPTARGDATTLWNDMKLKYADRVALERAQDHYRRQTSGLRNSFLSDPARIDGICGPDTIGEMLQVLDDIAADTILRPRTTLRGKVIVGPMEKADGPTAKPPTP